MFRLTRLLKVTKPFSSFFQGIYKPCKLTTYSIMLFSSQQRHRIFDMIQKDNAEDSFDKIVIQLATLSDKTRQQAVKSIIQAIQDDRLTLQCLVHQKFNIHLKKYPVLLYDGYFNRIISSISELIDLIPKKEDMAQKIVVKDINQSFVICFDAIKKMQVEVAAPKEIQIYKTFAQYHADCLKMLVEDSKVKGCLLKSKDFFKAALTKATLLLKSLIQKQKKLEAAESPTQIVEQRQKRNEAIQQIKYNKFEVIQEYSSIVTGLVDVSLQLTQREQQQKQSKQKKGQNKQQQQQKQDHLYPSQFGKETLDLEPLIEKSVKYYAMVPENKLNSQYYHKLKKISIQIKYEKKLNELKKSKKLEDEKQELVKQYQSDYYLQTEQLYDQSLQDFKNIDKKQLDLQDAIQFSKLLIAMKQHYLMKQQNNDIQKVQQFFGNQVSKYAAFFKDQTFRKQLIIGMTKQLKAIFGVNIERYVQKIPRSFKYKSRKRRSDMIE